MFALRCAVLGLYIGAESEFFVCVCWAMSELFWAVFAMGCAVSWDAFGLCCDVLGCVLAVLELI